MTRGRSRKKYRTPRKSTDENYYSQSGQVEEIGTPPAQCTSPRGGTEMNSSNPLQTEDQELGIIFIMQPLQSVRMPIIKYKEFLCSLLTALSNQYLMLHRHWRINHLRIQKAKNNFFNVLHPFGTATCMFLLNNWKNIAMRPIYLLLWQQFDILRLFFKA
jgi:hypothetical protein